MLKSRIWTPEEDNKLISLMESFNSNKWCVISESMGSRSPVQCMNRWTKILKPGLLKGYWSTEEDEQLLEWIKVNGPKKWSECAKFMKKRSAKQCRERWLNHLDPSIKKDDWTPEEDAQIFELYKVHGTSWSKLARIMKGRTENAIKNRFYSSIRSLIATENSNETIKKEKKKVNKNQGFFNVLKEKSQEGEGNIDHIKRKMMNHSSVRDPVQKKKKCADSFYENLYGKNFDDLKDQHKKDESTEIEEENKEPTKTQIETPTKEETTKAQLETAAKEDIKTKMEEKMDAMLIKQETTLSKEKQFIDLIAENIKSSEEKLGKPKQDIVGLQNDPLFKEFIQFRENMLLQQFEAFKAFLLTSNPFLNFGNN